MSSTANSNLIDCWITEYARDCMLSSFQNFELERANEVTPLIHGKLTTASVVVWLNTLPGPARENAAE